MNKNKYKLLLFLLFGFTFGSGSEVQHFNFPLYSILPFLGILLSIAIIPLVSHHFWEKYYGKVSLFWALSFILPFLFISRADAVREILHVILLEYLPFIILLFSLYTVAGGICLRGTIISSPSITWTLNCFFVKKSFISVDNVDFPAPDMPVIQTIWALLLTHLLLNFGITFFKFSGLREVWAILTTSHQERNVTWIMVERWSNHVNSSWIYF